MLIVDTGPLVATADRADKDHAACRQLLEASLYASIIEGQLEVADLGITDWQRIQDLVSTYADLRLGGTDASVIVLAEAGANHLAGTYLAARIRSRALQS